MTKEEINIRQANLKKYINAAAKISVKSSVLEGSTLAEVLDMDATKYSEVAFQSLNLSQRAFNCMSRYLNPPIQGIEERWQISDLLNLTIGNYVDVRNLGLEAFEEILSKIKELK